VPETSHANRASVDADSPHNGVVVSSMGSCGSTGIAAVLEGSVPSSTQADFSGGISGGSSARFTVGEAVSERGRKRLQRLTSQASLLLAWCAPALCERATVHSRCIVFQEARAWPSIALEDALHRGKQASHALDDFGDEPETLGNAKQAGTAF